MSVLMNHEAAPAERGLNWLPAPIVAGVASLALIGGGVALAENINNQAEAASTPVENVEGSHIQPVFDSSTSLLPHIYEQVAYRKKVAPKPWKYSFSKPSHGPLSPKLQKELNAITPRMYRTMKYVGDNCEGRRGKWHQDNGRFGGGENITDANWRSKKYRGTDFAPKAELATPAEQMDELMRIQVSFGWGVPKWCPLATHAPWSRKYKIFKHK